ncbi:hypothetical protein, partial [Aerosakkonema funiforme]|uniref:hypothetical protein n=1 Tax=Aerosakkonema funiforme TaxID=1246630 RepID=UPI0035B7B7AE
MKRTVKSILRRYSSPSTSKDSPGSFYSWSETQVMMKHNQSVNLTQNKFHTITIKSINSFNYPY